MADPSRKELVVHVLCCCRTVGPNSHTHPFRVVFNLAPGEPEAGRFDTVQEVPIGATLTFSYNPEDERAIDFDRFRKLQRAAQKRAAKRARK